jgi:hypothetical protein
MERSLDCLTGAKHRGARHGCSGNDSARTPCVSRADHHEVPRDTRNYSQQTGEEITHIRDSDKMKRILSIMANKGEIEGVPGAQFGGMKYRKRDKP